MFSYSQFVSDFTNPIVKACRGSIVSIENDVPYMVCTPFYKFGNYGENYTDEIDWESAVVRDKVDGCLIKLFNYKSHNLLESRKQVGGNLIVIDNADFLLNDDIRRFINFEFSNQYMLFSRNCDGLNVSDKSFKILKVEGNRITLEEEL